MTPEWKSRITSIRIWLGFLALFILFPQSLHLLVVWFIFGLSILMVEFMIAKQRRKLIEEMPVEERENLIEELSTTPLDKGE